MAIGCGPKCAKFLLILFNVVFWLSGLALIVLPSYILSKGMLKGIEDLVEQNIVKNLLIAILVVGIIIFVIAFCGCFGAIKESRLLLGMYIFFLILILFVQVALGILVIINRKKMKNRIDDEVGELIKKNYGKYNNVTETIDSMQQALSCCGYESYSDWQESFYENKTNKSNGTQYFPNSCCKNNECSGKEKPQFTMGCKKIIEEVFQSIFPLIIGVILGIAFFEIFVVICAFCLCRNTNIHAQEV